MKKTARSRDFSGCVSGLFKKLLLAEALFKLGDASTSIKDALLAGIERVAD